MTVQETINRIPLLQSLLYDLNLLPESLATFGKGEGTKEHFYMMTTVAHFEEFERQLLERKAND